MTVSKASLGNAPDRNLDALQGEEPANHANGHERSSEKKIIRAIRVIRGQTD